MKNPLISVIMLTYNREEFISRAIESVLAQTFTNYEYIIIDNGSTDTSGQIADKYVQKDDRIQVIHRGCGNIGSGRNVGLDMARGTYIAFIDDDDWCEKDFLAFLYHLAITQNAEVAIAGTKDKIFDEKLVMNAEQALLELLKREKYNVAFPAKLFWAKLFDGIRFSENAKYDDIELMPSILGRAKCIAYHGRPKYTFYRHSGNHSAWTANYKLLNAAILKEYLNVYKNRTKWLIENFPDSEAAWRYFEWSFLISMVDKIIRYRKADCVLELEEMIQELKGCQKEFLNCAYIQAFEREWIEKYVLSESKG